MHPLGKKADIEARAKALVLVEKSPLKPQSFQTIFNQPESRQERRRWYEVELDDGWIAMASIVAGTIMYTANCLAR